jgi:dolichyl-phosphate-mannose-protein mannosyltransferase
METTLGLVFAFDLEHVPTKKRLHSHGVRPVFNDDKEINEVSAYGKDNFMGDENDDWIIDIVNAKYDKNLRAMESVFTLKHKITGCYLMSRNSKLPKWGIYDLI